MSYTLILLVLPAFMFLFLGLLGGKMKPIVVGVLGTLSLAVMTVVAYIAAYQYFFELPKVDGAYQTVLACHYDWLQFTDKLKISIDIMLDPITVLMLVVITTVSLMVHIYSLGYMKGEKGFQRYYAFLSLFTFSMLGLVVASNIFQMYIFWELVGVSSFLLISFYYIKPSAVAAAKKAFIVTRFADFFFLVGILVISYFAESFHFDVLTNQDAPYLATAAGASFLGISALSWALMLIFIGGAGKSAMMPFHIWLPDAMEGPTPASALIHAATMVVAGVFLVARLFPIYVGTQVLEIIGYIGAITALYAAIVACAQTDIKRVLAFSTISQIAFMITSLGVSGYSGHDGVGYMASMFHLFTHAFFKALLFLGAGAIIHAVHSNEMKDMGGLAKKLPITHITFLIACLAIAGIPLFSGFYSKDEILAAALHHNIIIYAMLSFTAGLTAFYMFRLYFRIFHNGNDQHYHHKPHEASPIMTIPLIILAVITVAIGLGSQFGLFSFADFISADMKPFEAHIDWIGVALPSIAIGLVGIIIAYVMYYKKSNLSDKFVSTFNWLYKGASARFYFDELWLFVTRKILFNCVSRPIAWFDRHIVDGFMDSLAYVTNGAADKIKGLQSGRIQQYAFVYLIGALLLVVTFVFMICFICR